MATTQTMPIPNQALREITIAVGLAGLTAAAAKLAIPLPFTPVPATLQVAAVVFAGAAFGPRRGALSQVLYLLAGFSGLPVFAAAPVAPTVGYLLAFPLAAFLAGSFVHSNLGRWLGAFAGLAVIYAMGGAYLAIWVGAHGAETGTHWVWLAGVWPFLPLDVLKTALAVFTAGPIRRRLTQS